jgi:hypothetical protein
MPVTFQESLQRLDENQVLQHPATQNGDGNEEPGQAQTIPMPKTTFQKFKPVILLGGAILLGYGLYWAYNKYYKAQAPAGIPAQPIAPTLTNATPPANIQAPGAN